MVTVAQARVSIEHRLFSVCISRQRAQHVTAIATFLTHHSPASHGGFSWGRRRRKSCGGHLHHGNTSKVLRLGGSGCNGRRRGWGFERCGGVAWSAARHSQTRKLGRAERNKGRVVPRLVAALTGDVACCARVQVGLFGARGCACACACAFACLRVRVCGGGG